MHFHVSNATLRDFSQATIGKKVGVVRENLIFANSFQNEQFALIIVYFLWLSSLTSYYYTFLFSLKNEGSKRHKKVSQKLRKLNDIIITSFSARKFI